jgi:predicted ABC-type ATPase
LLIVAGPNGSGKSSAFHNTEIEAFGQSVWLINPDVLALRIRKVEKKGLGAANLDAVRRIETWLESSVAAHQTVGVETVLSTDKYRGLVLRAKALQFEIRLVYVILDAPERNVERVRLRVRKGGHSVPTRKVIERYHRSLMQLPWFLREADRAWIFDNSGAAPQLIARKQHAVIELDEHALPAIAQAVRSIQTS